MNLVIDGVDFGDYLTPDQLSSLTVLFSPNSDFSISDSFMFELMPDVMKRVMRRSRAGKNPCKPLLRANDSLCLDEDEATFLNCMLAAAYKHVCNNKQRDFRLTFTTLLREVGVEGLSPD